MPILTGNLLGVESHTCQFPKFFTIAPFTITKPTNKFTWLCPLPTTLNSLGKQLVIFLTYLSRDPVSTVSLNTSQRPPKRLRGGEGSRSREYTLHHFLALLPRLRGQVVTNYSLGMPSVLPNAKS